MRNQLDIQVAAWIRAFNQTAINVNFIELFSSFRRTSGAIKRDIQITKIPANIGQISLSQSDAA